MNKNMLKKATAVLGLVLTLSFFTGIIPTTTVQAQNRDHRWNRDNNRRNNDRRDWNRRDNDRRDWDRGDNNRREWERRREIARQRAIQEARRREWERDRYRNSRNYPYYGNNGGGYYGGGYNGYGNSEVQRGYNNGLKEGLDDARDRDSFNPSRHSSFRDGNQFYREGFYRGYQQGFRQAGYRRW